MTTTRKYFCIGCFEVRDLAVMELADFRQEKVRRHDGRDIGMAQVLLLFLNIC